MDHQADPAREDPFGVSGANAGSDREAAIGSASTGSSAETRELAELRELLLGGERRQLEELRRRLDTLELTPDEIAEHLPEAIAIRGARDGRLARALAPTIDGTISESIRRNPREFAAAIVPVLGSAIRQAVADRVSELFESVVPTDRSRATGKWVRFAWLVPLILLLGLGAVWLVRSNLRWSRVVAALEQEPGIVLVRADRSLDGWRFTGLRDPLAANPAVLLARLGADTTSIDARWEPYVSTQPPLVLARARRVLDPPATVALTLAGDTLVARGQASRRWLERATTIAATLPGVANADLSGVVDVIPPELESLRRATADQRVLFSAGSDSLDAAGRDAADTIAARLARLRVAAEHEGYESAVVLIGRTDTLGTRTEQVDLARRRAMAVHAALVAAGIPASEIGVRSLGSTDPLPADDPDSVARINRSVALEVIVAHDAASAFHSPAGER